MEIKTILWPTDLSDNSLQAIDHVSSLAQKHGAKVILFYVAFSLDSFFPAYGDRPSQELADRFQEWEGEVAKTRMRHLCDNKLCGCPYLDVRTATGNPGAEILKMVDQENVDLVIMPTKGRSQAMEGEFFGSVADKVIKNSPVPVYVINPKNKVR